MDLEFDDIECLWIEVLFFMIKGFFVGFIYCFLDLLKYFFKSFNCKLELMFMSIFLENKEYILIGDMNWNYLVNLDYRELKFIMIVFGLK